MPEVTDANHESEPESSRKMGKFSVALIVGLIWFGAVGAGMLLGSPCAIAAPRIQILDGICDSTSHTAEGPIGSDLANRQSRFFCDSAVITFLGDYKGHIMLQFVQSKAHHTPILAFSGRVEDDGIMMPVERVYLVPGQPTTVSDGWCKFFFTNRQISSLFCGMTVNETGRRTTAIVVFDAVSPGANPFR